MGSQVVVLLVLALAWGAVAGGAARGFAAAADTTAAPAIHPELMADLTVDGPYPRFTAAQLAASGYPDHMHAFFWPGWQPPVGSRARPADPIVLCAGTRPVERAGLTIAPGHVAFGPFTLDFSPAYEPCELIGMIELCDWARERVRNVLGLQADVALHLRNPDNMEIYQAWTGYSHWRLYQLDGDSCRVSPIPALFARTMAAHAAVELTARWTIDRCAGDRSPLWLRQGLAAYVADMGQHLTNFVARHRVDGPVLFPPAEIDAILGGPPNLDAARDEKRFRCASYAAFVMAWRLVEDHGGLAAARDALARLSRGESWASVCNKVYGQTPDRLAALLDPTVGPEPIGTSFEQRRPHLPPGMGGS